MLTTPGSGRYDVPVRRALLPLLLSACSGGEGAPGADLSGFAKARITVGGTEFEVYLAETPAERQQGLMFATEGQLTPLLDGTPRGMLFVFPAEATLSFWMRDTGVPLDLAYAKADGTIVEIHDLVPFDETLVPSGEPVQYALETLSGTLAELGITPGSVIEPP
jgi:hypothetical protein